MQDFLLRILEKHPDTAIILCQNLSDDLPYQVAQGADQHIITKLMDTTIAPEGLLGMLHQIISQHRQGRTPHIYINTGDVGDNNEKTSGYASLVG
jgi:hypothetical protein